MPDDDIWNTIEQACTDGDLKGLYAIQDKDTGPEAHQNSRFSSIIIKENSYIRGNDIYLNAYFDNENSVNRFFDLLNHIVTRL
jgi:glyceraldehyde 3-phosphate dehydrogenase